MYNITFDGTFYSIIENKKKAVLTNIILKECAEKILLHMPNKNILKVLDLLELHSQYERHLEDYNIFEQSMTTATGDRYHLFESRKDNAESQMDSVYENIVNFK